MKNQILITINDCNRLQSLIDVELSYTKMSEYVSHMSDALKNARMIAQDDMPANVITMNSKVLLRHVLTEREAELTITYPQMANSFLRKISVFSSIGTALLGKQVGDTVSWKTPTGDGKFEILKIVYQPEAVGDYSL